MSNDIGFFDEIDSSYNEITDFTEKSKKEEHTIIKLKTEEYIFDVNSLLLPFIAEYRGDKVDRIEVEQNDIKIIVEGPKSLGVPTLYDKSLLMAAQKIFLQQNTVNNVLRLKKNDITEKDRTTEPISLRELHKAMGYKNNPTVHQLLKMCNSIRRLTATTYTTKKDRILDKNQERQVVMKAEQGLHLIKYNLVTLSEVEKENRKKHASKKSNDKEKSLEYQMKKAQVFDGAVQIIFDEVTYKAMIFNQFVFYQDQKVLNIKNQIARHIYLLAFKWAGGKGKSAKISIKTLMTYIAMKEDIDLKHKKQNIKKALNELNKNKDCHITYLKGDVIQFHFGEKEDTDTTPDYMRNKFNTFGEMLQGFMDLGLTQEEVFGLNMQKQRYYEALVRYATIRKHYGGIENTRDYVLNYIKNEYPIDSKYYSQQ